MNRKAGRPPGGLTVDNHNSYMLWNGIKQRCHNPNSHVWKHYGGRGITMCDRWRYSFIAFLTDMGPRPKGKWIDRIDNSKGYEPGNCRWVTPKESANNRRKTGPKPDPESLSQRAKAAGLPYMLVYLRVRNLGWTEYEALTTPKLKRGRPYKS